MKKNTSALLLLRPVSCFRQSAYYNQYFLVKVSAIVTTLLINFVNKLHRISDFLYPFFGEKCMSNSKMKLYPDLL